MAVIDLGSNSARVVVIERPVTGVLEVVAEKQRDLRLATHLDEHSRLDERGIELTLEAVGAFADFARKAGARSINVVATAAIRRAGNRADLLARAQTELGLAINVLDGAEEAEFAAMGALHGLPIRSGVVVDIGGGSTEVARVVAGVIVGAWSFPLGALSASAAWLEDDPPKPRQVKALRRMAAETIAGNAPSALEAGEALIGTGGSTRALARLAQRRGSHPIPSLHGYSLEADTVRGLATFLASHTQAERCAIDGVRAGRADSIVGGAVILQEIMRRLGAERLTVATGGLREGVAMRAFGEPVPQPRLVRAAAVEGLLRRHSAWDATDMEARAARADTLPPDLLADPFSDILEAARLASMLRALGEADGRKGAGARAAGILLGEGLDGFDHAMVARVAALLHFSDGRAKGDGETLLALLPRSERRLLQRCGALLA